MEYLLEERKAHHCQDCDKSFSTKGSLVRHVMTHSGEKPFKCDLCSKSFFQKDKLVRHSSTHSGIKPFKCEQCDKSFPHKDKLDRHLITHDIGEKQYKCELCNKSYSRQDQLKTHRMSHTGEKPYKCELCDSAFSLKGNLNVHLMTHTGEKPHKCEHCDKSFSRKGDLDRHVMNHTGEKPFKCYVCNKAFVRRDLLENHLRVHVRKDQCKPQDYTNASNPALQPSYCQNEDFTFFNVSVKEEIEIKKEDDFEMSDYVEKNNPAHILQLEDHETKDITMNAVVKEEIEDEDYVNNVAFGDNVMKKELYGEEEIDQSESEFCMLPVKQEILDSDNANFDGN